MKGQAVDEKLGQLAAGVEIKLLDAAPGDVHFGGTHFLREAKVVDETNGLVLLDGHGDAHRVAAFFGVKFGILG